MSDLLSQIRELLWLEWDPIGVNQISVASDEYDAYAKQVHKMLLAGRDGYAICQYLERSALVDIGVSRSVNHEAIAARAIELFGETK